MARDIVNNAAVDRGQAAPLYHQIFLQLREEITSGERGYGFRMPTEKQLAMQFNVSRITARRALDELAGNNFVARKRRVGTTVVFKAPPKPIQGRIDQGAESLINFGQPSQVKLLECGMRAVLPPVDEALGVEPLTEVLRVVRVHLLNGHPVGHFVIYLPPSVSKGITRAELKSASMFSLVDKASIQVCTARQTVSATIADAALSLALDTDIGSPLLRVSRTLFDNNGLPVQHVLARFRPDQYQVNMDLDIHGAVAPVPSRPSQDIGSLPVVATDHAQ